jgi:hypothetical protein
MLEMIFVQAVQIVQVVQTVTEVQNVLPPSLILSRDAGEERGGGLNGAQAIERFERLELRSYLAPSKISR